MGDQIHVAGEVRDDEMANHSVLQDNGIAMTLNFPLLIVGHLPQGSFGELTFNFTKLNKMTRKVLWDQLVSANLLLQQPLRMSIMAGAYKKGLRAADRTLNLVPILIFDSNSY